MHQVLFYSMGGNTRKLADAIAEELGAKSADVKAASIDPGAGVIFLGSGCYGGKPGEDMMKFIGKNDFTGRRVALFGTSAWGHGKEVQAMEDALKQKGANVVGSYYTKGKFLVVVSMGHPNEDDLAGARKFAREMAKLG
jgi:flavodoxin